MKKPFKRIVVSKGGKGSGHHGHKGRPGQRGGSAPRGAGDVSDQGVSEFAKMWEDLENDENIQSWVRRYHELVRVDDLWPMREYDRSVRTHKPPGWIDSMRESIRAHGILDPLILDYSEVNNKMKIAEGNHRLMIARELGIKWVPARVVVSHRTAHEKGAEVEPIDEWHGSYGSKPSHFNIETKPWED